MKPTAQERAIIKAFANGDKTLREQSIKIFHQYLDGIANNEDHALQFMSEIDNPCPDHILRNRFRRLLIEEL